MPVPSWLRTLIPRPAGRTTRPVRRPAARLRVENLEDRTVPSATLVKDINATSAPLLHAADWTQAGGRTFFTAEDVNHGRELWVIGSPGQVPRLVKDLTPGPDSSDFGQFVAVGSDVYFTANTDGYPRSWFLWKSDGTAAGTDRVDDHPVPVLIGAAGSTVFFRLGGELWTTNGTVTARAQIINANSDPGITSPVAIGGTLYFVADDGIHGRELWQSDGTAAGTHIAKDIYPGNRSSGITSLTVFCTFRDFLSLAC